MGGSSGVLEAGGVVGVCCLPSGSGGEVPERSRSSLLTPSGETLSIYHSPPICSQTNHPNGKENKEQSLVRLA